MTAEEKFEANREAFRKWITDEGFSEHELFKLMSDIVSKLDYMQAMESIQRSGYQPN